MDKRATRPLYSALIAISAAHLINDALQAVIPASYPILKQSLGLDYIQLGWLTFVLYFSSSVLQPFVGMFADKRPMPRMMPAGMVIALAGMLGIAVSPYYGWMILSVLLVGIASAVFHPEGARIAYLAAGDRRGLAQSIFQVGGNAGGALAPLMTAFIFFPFGQAGAAWFALLSVLGFAIQWRTAKWYAAQLAATPSRSSHATSARSPIRTRAVGSAVALVVLLVFARSWYGAGISNYYVFHLIERFEMSIPMSQMYLFCYMAAGIVGTFIGGPLADWLGRKTVILWSLLGSLPFALALPYAGELASLVFLLVIGVIQHSSFSVTVVYVQELVPGKIGTVSGLVTGMAFGLGALGAVVMGGMIDIFGLAEVMIASSLLPFLGFAGIFLPAESRIKRGKTA